MSVHSTGVPDLSGDLWAAQMALEDANRQYRTVLLRRSAQERVAILEGEVEKIISQYPGIGLETEISSGSGVNDADCSLEVWHPSLSANLFDLHHWGRLFSPSTGVFWDATFNFYRKGHESEEPEALRVYRVFHKYIFRQDPDRIGRDPHVYSPNGVEASLYTAMFFNDQFKAQVESGNPELYRKYQEAQEKLAHKLINRPGMYDIAFDLR